MRSEPFLDFYEILQISPHSEQEAVERVYRLMAARYHPDNPRTGDREKYSRLEQAYRQLSREDLRRAYDQKHQARGKLSLNVFGRKEFDGGIDGEANRRLGILCLLYARRRANPEAVGLSILDLENLTGFPREHLLFTLWYLKETDLVGQEESTDFSVTRRGVDFVEQHLSSNQPLYQLIKGAECGDFERIDVDTEGNNGQP